MKNYLIKRNPVFSQQRVAVKRNDPMKPYAETIMTASKKSLASRKVEIGDTIFLAENSFGVYAKGTVVKSGELASYSFLQRISSEQFGRCLI